jgi:EAL and modified HD-GYP domain-containing signal transduction protein
MGRAQTQVVPRPTHEVCIARQGIHDLVGRPVGHELLFRPTALSTVSGVRPGVDDDSATASVIAATLGEFGVSDVAGDGLLFVNIPRAFVVGTLPVALSPDRVVLEVLERVDSDEETLAGVQRLKDEGFGIALDDYVPGDHRAPMLELCEYVKVDIEDLGDDLAEFAAELRAACPHATLIAERIETEVDLETAHAAGFDLFQGYYFRRPVVLSRPALAHHALVAGRLLIRLGDPHVSFRVIARLTAADPSIALKVLRVVNSASGAGRPVRNLHQALVLLGRERFRAMLILEILVTAGHHDDELPLRSLARTRAAEILAPHSPLEASTEELVRIVSELLQVPVAELDPALHRVAPSPDVIDACDVLDGYLRAIDRDDLPQIDAPFSALDVSHAYLTAVKEARALLSTVFEPVDRPGGLAL